VVRLDDAEEALVDEGCQSIEDVDAELAVRIAHHSGALDGRAAEEDREAPEERALGRVEEVVAPSDRPAKRPLPIGAVAGSAGQEAEPFPESGEDGVGREELDSRRGELDRER